MKHLLISLGILAMLLAVSLCSLQLLSQTTQDVISELQLAQECLRQENSSGVFFHTKRARELWMHSEALFGVLLDHSEMSEITSHFSSLFVCVQQQVLEEFSYRCAELISMLEHTAKMEQPYYYNIL